MVVLAVPFAKAGLLTTIDGWVCSLAGAISDCEAAMIARTVRRNRSNWRGACLFAMLTTTGFATTSAQELKSSVAPQAEGPRPNFLIVLADDLGYGDLACYGGADMKTPNLDRLAQDGLRLTNCYSAHANCSPSRTGLLTGRTPSRVGVYSAIPMESPMHLRKQEITIATLLRQSGYDTCHVGKWHLNGHFNQPGQPQPPDHGFDYWFSTQNNALPSHRNPENFVRNGKPVGRIEGYASRIVADEAVHWLKDERDPEKPFFLYVCFHEPHEPIASDKKYSDLYPSTNPSFSAHHGNITQMDDNFGRLLGYLDEAKLRDNTFVFFSSDNGPAITAAHPHGSAGPLRDKKGSMYEGGIRVPGIIRWPAGVRAGQTSHEPVCGVDLLPTLCAMTNTPVPNDRALDGASVVPVFTGATVSRKRPLYWHFNAAHSKVKVALREGDWKILAELSATDMNRFGADITETTMRAMKTAEPTTYELYNLQTDVAETTNLVQSDPDQFRKLADMLKTTYHEVRDEAPSWPPFDVKAHPYEADRIQWPEYYQKKAAKKKK